MFLRIMLPEITNPLRLASDCEKQLLNFYTIPAESKRQNEAQPSFYFCTADIYERPHRSTGQVLL